MLFEAELKKKKYQIVINEEPHEWKISILKEGGNWKHFDISKDDYHTAEQLTTFLFKGSSYLIDVIGSDTNYTVFTRGSYRTVKVYNDEMLLHESLKKGTGMGTDLELKAGMPGKIIEIFVKPGDVLSENDPILIMEAMKMENEMRAQNDVKVKEICVDQGDSVESGAILVTFEPV